MRTPNVDAQMVEHKIMPMPDASVGRVLGLMEVLYAYGGHEKISFLSEELSMPIDQLGPVIDMAELFGLLRVHEGIATLTVYGEAVNLGTIDDKKRVLKKRISSIEPFRTAANVLRVQQSILEQELYEKIKEKYTIADPERFHKLFVGWGTFTGLFEYDSGERTFRAKEAKQ